jgi:hypothetical protein
MKKIALTALLGILALAVVGCSATRTARPSEADTAKARQVSKMLDEHLYKADFNRAHPMSAPSFPLTSPYFVSVIGERVESFLPYFGRAYNVPYGGGEGLRFAAPISDYAEKVTKRGVREITFRAKTQEDVYDFRLSVTPQGECNLSIAPGQKQQISFSGHIDLAPEFEVVRVK